MARTFLVPIDLNGNELLNAVAQTLASAPIGKPDGHWYYNSTSGTFQFKQGGSYVGLGSGGGDVSGPGAAVSAGNLVSWNGTSGTSVADSGVAVSSIVTAGSTHTLTNKTFDANGTGNSLTNVEVADLATSAKTGQDAKVVTGTAGTSGHLAEWNADGDAVGSGISSSSVSTAVSASHTQHTDTGTTQSSFQLDSGNSGPKLVNSGGELRVRNAANDAYADIRVRNLYVEGTTTEVASNEVNIGDSTILLNSDVTTSGANSDGGIAVKRLDTDNTTRRDATFLYNNTTHRWEATWGIHTAALNTDTVALKRAFDVGNGSDTQITLTHNFGTRDVQVEVFLNSGNYGTVEVDVERTSTTQVRLTFATAPASNAYRAVITG